MNPPAAAHRTAPRAAFQRASLALFVSAAALLAWPLARAAIPGDATHSLPPLDPPAAAASMAATPAPPAWWAAYGEAPLDRLMVSTAQGAAAPGRAAQNELVQAYVLMRVQQVRLGLATQLLQALQAERELLRRQSPTRDVAQALSTVDQRTAYAEGLVANFVQLRDTAAQRLVHKAAQDGDELRNTVRVALGQDSLPEFRAAVPDRLPAAVLLTRDDVASLRSELAAQGQGDMTLNGWILPAPEAPAAPALERELQARSPDQTLRQAGLDVSWSLRQLAEARAAAVADAQRMDARRLEVMAARQRAEVGDLGPTDVLEVYLRFLGDADQAAQSQGVLALAWAALHRQAPGAWQVLSASRR
jgi:hypothetical protein